MVLTKKYDALPPSDFSSVHRNTLLEARLALQTQLSKKERVDCLTVDWVLKSAALSLIMFSCSSKRACGVSFLSVQLCKNNLASSEVQ